MKNLNKIINNFYCNGYFSRRYDLSGAIIEGEGIDWIVIRPVHDAVDGNEPCIATFDSESEKQEMIDRWTYNQFEEDNE